MMSIDLDVEFTQTDKEIDVEIEQSDMSMGVDFGEYQTLGIPGKDGLSAYEIALRHGFAGTEQQWLDSLKGEPGIPGDKGDPGEKGDKGDAGSDATVTKTNIETALGYKPASVDDVLAALPTWEGGSY